MKRKEAANARVQKYRGKLMSARRHPLTGSVETDLTVDIKEAAFEWLWRRRKCRHIAPEARIFNDYVADLLAVSTSRQKAVICVEVKQSWSDLRRDIYPTAEEAQALRAEDQLVRDVVRTLWAQIRRECRVKTGIETTVSFGWGHELRVDRQKHYRLPYEEARQLDTVLFDSRYYHAIKNLQLPRVKTRRGAKFWDPRFRERFTEAFIALPAELASRVPEDLPWGVLAYTDGHIRQVRKCPQTKIDDLDAEINRGLREISRVNTQRLVQTRGEVTMDGISWDRAEKHLQVFPNYIRVKSHVVYSLGPEDLQVSGEVVSGSLDIGGVRVEVTVDATDYLVSITYPQDDVGDTLVETYVGGLLPRDVDNLPKLKKKTNGGKP